MVDKWAYEKEHGWGVKLVVVKASKMAVGLGFASVASSVDRMVVVKESMRVVVRAYEMVVWMDVQKVLLKDGLLVG